MASRRQRDGPTRAAVTGRLGDVRREALTCRRCDLWERGKRRIHEKPNREEILACRFWLDQEIALVRPRVLVALGATAAGVVIGPSVKVTKDRGRAFPSPLADFVTVTVHPSSILRSPDDESRREARRQFVADLRAIAKRIGASG